MALSNEIKMLFETYDKLNESRYMAIERKQDEIKAILTKQNGRIATIENETRIFRLIHRNPRTSIVIIILIIVGSFTLLPFVMKAIF